MNELSHVDTEGRARMVDVSRKAPMLRRATAEGYIRLAPPTVERIEANAMKKGDVLAVAEIAGIQAAKQTGTLIPLCHPLNLSNVRVKAQLEPQGVRITGEVSCVGPTGVEMEALTAVAVALLSIYDMCKAIDGAMVIENIELLEKAKKEIE